MDSLIVMTLHIFPEDRVHYYWDRELEPVIRVSPGDTVYYELREVSDGQINPASNPEVLREIDWGRVYPLAGPVYVEGAEAGDALEVEVLDIHPGPWGWSAIIPGFGLLEDEFREPKLKIWDLSYGDHTYFREDIKIPLEPFCGTMGVAPKESGKRAVMPPGMHGGNMDIKHLMRGSRLLLPVWVDGALFSVGDPHAAQGDGEVCVTGIEAPMHLSLRFKLRKRMNLDAPQYITPPRPRCISDEAGYHSTLGIGPDLFEASRDAIRRMVNFIADRWKMERWEAYILCSVVVDLKLSEVVDKPNWIVSAHLPLSIFQDK
ncbi:MAG: acetamidase/formamidase family protein [Candidatus Bathyarchaeia archaeon]